MAVIEATSRSTCRENMEKSGASVLEQELLFMLLRTGYRQVLLGTEG